MTSMLTILPLLCFLSLFLLLGNIQINVGWRRTFLRSAIIWGFYAIIILELISLISKISLISLSIVWCIPTIFFFAKLLQRYRQTNQIKFPAFSVPDHWMERLLILSIGVVTILTFIVALMAPPQTGDSYVYHMSRVAHWAQNQSIAPFVTGIRFQNTMSQAAELIILHFYVLAGADTFANLPQWFAMVGSLIGVSLISSQLSLKQTGGFFAVAFAVSIPMGIVQASSTMTDYLVTFWIVCVVSEGLNLLQVNNLWKDTTFLGLATGLAIATKPTSFAFLLPFAFLIPLKLLRRIPVKRLIYVSLLICVCILLINIGHYARNYTLYGSPLGHEGTIQRHANEQVNGKIILSNVLRHASLHAGTPWSDLNDWIYLQIAKIHIKIDQDLNDPKTTFTEFRILKPSTDENIVTNPVHAYLIILSFLLSLVFWRRLDGTKKIYGFSILLGFIMFCVLFKYQIFASRLQLSFFVLIAPFIGSVFSMLRTRNLILFGGVALILFSTPWLFSINTRPIYPNNQTSTVRSIFSETREDLYFSSSQSKKVTYTTLAGLINNENCTNIGLFLTGSSPEYLWWVIFNAPRADIKIEWLVSDSPTTKYEDPDFVPCAILCENCPGEWTVFRGLPVAFDAEDIQFKLFLRAED